MAPVFYPHRSRIKKRDISTEHFVNLGSIKSLTNDMIQQLESTAMFLLVSVNSATCVAFAYKDRRLNWPGDPQVDLFQV